MNRLRGRFALRGLVAATLLLAALAGCARLDSEQAGPVTTKTEAGTTTAPAASEVSARKNALVRFVHTVPGLAPVDVFAGDSKAFDAVIYKYVTAYRELPPASAPFRLRLAGQDAAEPLAQETKSFGTGRYHTIVAFPASGSSLLSKGGGLELRFLTDELEPPSAGKARVRVVNASPDLGEIDLYATGRTEPLLKGANAGAATAYVETEPTEAGLEVRRAGENITTLAVPGTKLEAGRLYTIFIVGGTKGTAKLESFVVEDQLGAAPQK
jgi:hypothetical protein